MQTFEAVVVGGGVVGAATAWRLAQRGVRVACFDRGESGAATPAAGGILCAQAEMEGDGPFFDLLLDAEEAHARVAQELGADRIGYQGLGVLRVAESPAQLAALTQEREWQRARNLSVDALEPKELGDYEPALAPSLRGANLFLRGAQVDSRALLAALVTEGQAEGVVRLPHSVKRILTAGDRVRGVRTATEDIEAPVVILAAGAWSSAVEGSGLDPLAVQPVRGQMLELAMPGRRLTRVVFGAGGYVVPRGDRLIVGSTMEKVGFTLGTSGSALTAMRARAVALCPSAVSAPQTGAWSGFRPATADGLPAMGPTPIAGLQLGVGFLRNGILLAPLAAELLATIAVGGTNAVPAPFAAARLFRPAPSASAAAGGTTAQGTADQGPLDEMGWPDPKYW